MNGNTKRLFKNIGSFVGVIAVSVLTLFIMSLIAERVGESTADNALNRKYGDILPSDRYEELDLSGAGESYSAVTAAYRGEKDGNTEGYIIELSVKGYGGDIEVTAGVSADGMRITGIKIGRHSETEGIGGRITENAFLEQFKNTAAPLTLGRSTLTDGTYYAEADSFDGGYKDNVTVTVENGRIIKAVWDGKSETGGKSKRQASIDREYIMTADGLLWHEQAQLMEARLIELQDPTRLVFGEDGRTDAVAGVSIKINPFVSLSQQCCAEAGGASEGSAVDGISGATVSSNAVVFAANTASDFTRGFILKEGVGIPDSDGGEI